MTTGTHRKVTASITHKADRDWLAEHYDWFLWPAIAFIAAFCAGLLMFTLTADPPPSPDLPGTVHQQKDTP